MSLAEAADVDDFCGEAGGRIGGGSGRGGGAKAGAEQNAAAVASGEKIEQV